MVGGLGAGQRFARCSRTDCGIALHCMLSAQTAAELAIQMHGGAGFTWEYGLHHFYRAAMFARHYLTHEHGVRASLAASIRRSSRLHAEIGAAA